MNLLISEYIEGSSNNKAIELYNATESAIDLAGEDRKLEFYFNGNTSAGTTMDLTGTIANENVFLDRFGEIRLSADGASNSPRTDA